VLIERGHRDAYQYEWSRFVEIIEIINELTEERARELE